MNIKIEESGLNNIKKILQEHVGVLATDKFILENFETLGYYFPKFEECDDEEDINYTFEVEANSGCIFDTSPRENFLAGFSQTLIKRDWPMNMDGEEVFKEFIQNLNDAISKHPELEFV